MRLRALKLSCSFFSYPRPLFSIVCGLFDENTRGGIPLSHLHGSHLTSHKLRFSPEFRQSQDTSHQSRLAKSFRFRSYRNSARNPFRIRSYENPRGVEGSPLSILSPVPSAHSVNSAVSRSSPRLFPSETNNLQPKTVNSRPWTPRDTCSPIDTLLSQGRSRPTRPECQNSLVPQTLAPLACVSKPDAGNGAAIAPLSSVVFHAAIRVAKRPLPRGCRTLFFFQDDHGA